MTNLDHLITHLNRWLADAPAHLVALSSVGFFVFGLWTIGYQLGVL